MLQYLFSGFFLINCARKKSTTSLCHADVLTIPAYKLFMSFLMSHLSLAGIRWLLLSQLSERRLRDGFFLAFEVLMLKLISIGGIYLSREHPQSWLSST